MDVSIIIVNHNTSSLVIQCVKSVIDKTNGVKYEIIVVDNGSSAVDLLALRGYGTFKLVESTENLGFGRANNLGAEYAGGKYILLLNPDTELKNNALLFLWEYMEQHEKCGICGGNIYDMKGMPAHSFHVWYPSILSEMDFASGRILRKLIYGRNMQFNYTDKPKNVAMITGADLMIRHDVWSELKGFDPQFFMYCEDADLCCRTKLLGYDIASVPQSEIIHLEGQSFHRTELRCRLMLDGRFIYFRKHHGKLYNAVSDCLNLLTINSSIMIYAILGKHRQKETMIVRRKVYSELMHSK